MHYEDRTYATALTIELSNVDFSQVMETAQDTIRKSVDETEFLIKFETDHEPTFITDGSVVPTWSGNYDACLVLMATSEWQSPIDL